MQRICKEMYMQTKKITLVLTCEVRFDKETSPQLFSCTLHEIRTDTTTTTTFSNVIHSQHLTFRNRFFLNVVVIQIISLKKSYTQLNLV